MTLFTPPVGLTAVGFLLVTLITPLGVAAGPPPAAVALAALHERGDGPGFLRELDLAIYADLVAELPAGERPPRPPFDLPALRASLNAVTAIVAFHVAGDSVFAAALTRDRISTSIADVPSLRIMAARLQNWMADPQTTTYDVRAAHQVWLGLFSPLSTALGGKRCLIVSASGPLAGLPFDALPLSAPEAGEEETPVFLGERYEWIHEPTPATRLAWGSIPSASAPLDDEFLHLTKAAAGRSLARAALAQATAGAPYALVCPPSASAAGALLETLRARRTAPPAALSRHVTAAKRLQRRQTAPTTPHLWALPLLYGGR